MKDKNVKQVIFRGGYKWKGRIMEKIKEGEHG
jgi:hypothetical protein